MLAEEVNEGAYDFHKSEWMLFWMDIRENAVLRYKTWATKNQVRTDSESLALSANAVADEQARFQATVTVSVGALAVGETETNPDKPCRTCQACNVM